MNDTPSTESPAAIVAQYILECRGKGAFLSYEEYSIVDIWVSACSNADQILLILSDLFDSDDESAMQKNSTRSLKYYEKVVKKRLEHHLASRS